MVPVTVNGGARWSECNAGSRTKGKGRGSGIYAGVYAKWMAFYGREVENSYYDRRNTPRRLSSERKILSPLPRVRSSDTSSVCILQRYAISLPSSRKRSIGREIDERNGESARISGITGGQSFS